MNKTRGPKLVAVMLGCLTFSQAQTASTEVNFDVAAIRPLAAGLRTGLHGGPGTADPTNLDWRAPLAILISRAYDVDLDQIVPDWRDLMVTNYQVLATIPVGTSQEGFRQMLQNLLAERFRLVISRESKMVRAYRLVIAKGGSKLKVSEYVPAARPAYVQGQQYFGDLPLFSTEVGGQWTVTGRRRNDR